MENVKVVESKNVAVSFMDFDLFEKIFGAKVASIGLVCSKCGKFWGFRIYDEKNISEIKQNKLVCFACATNRNDEPQSIEQETV